MSATLLDSRFSDAVERAVTDIETRTDAEIVVVAARRSGTYRDTALLTGAIAGLAVLTFVLHSPWTFAPTFLPLEVAGIAAVVAWWASSSPTWLRWLTSEKRRRSQVTRAAHQSFHQDAVHATRGRTGLLVYFSTLERHVVLVPDLGLDARIPHVKWNAVTWNTSQRTGGEVDDLDGFLHGLEQVGTILAAAIPPIDDNPDELPNRPRIRT